MNKKIETSLGIALVIYGQKKFISIFIFIAYLAWLSIGFTQWRHCDDFGPLADYMQNGALIPHYSNFKFGPGNFGNLSIIHSLKSGWGTFPPLWQFLTLLSSIFVPFSITFSRYFTFTLAFIFLSLGSVFLSSCLIHICNNFSKNSRKFVENNKHNILHVICLTLILFNPEIIAHAPTYMPYYLPILFVIISLNLLVCLIFSSDSNFHKNQIYLTNPFIIFSLFLITLSLGFQLLLLLPCLFISILTVIFNNKKFYFKIKSFNFSKSKIFFKKYLLRYLSPFSLLLLVLSFDIFNKYFDKAFGLKNAGLNVGGWANGIDKIYSLNVEKIDFHYFTKLFYVLSKICGLALYPYYSNQDIASLIIFSIIILGFIVNSIRYRSKLTPITIFILSTFLINIYYSTSSAYILAPTRHSIFLFPFFIYGIFITFFSLINNFKLKKSTFTFTSILLCTSLFSTFYFGTNNAISELKYDKKEYSKLIKMAKNADFYTPSLHTYHKRTADPFSNILLHDDQVFRALHPKYCSSENETNLSKYKLFLYSHRHPIIFEGKNSMRKNMVNGCFPLTAEYKILSKIEVKGYRDIEHDNNVGNGGSGLYGYLVEITK